MNAERIKDRAAVILAGILANPEYVGPDGWGAAMDAMRQAVAIDGAAAAMLPGPMQAVLDAARGVIDHPDEPHFVHILTAAMKNIA